MSFLEVRADRSGTSDQLFSNFFSPWISHPPICIFPCQIGKKERFRINLEIPQRISFYAFRHLRHPFLKTLPPLLHPPLLPPPPLLPASCFLPLASCFLPLASCFLPLASYLLLLASCFLPLASCLFLLASSFLPLASYSVTTCPVSQDWMIASMMRWTWRASAPEASISSGLTCARFCSTHTPMRLLNVSPKLIMPPI